jgi:hypothetical protein
VTVYGSVTPIILSGQTLININGLSYIERNDIRRSVYDRLVNAVIAIAVSAVIALHDKWWR